VKHWLRCGYILLIWSANWLLSSSALLKSKIIHHNNIVMLAICIPYFLILITALCGQKKAFWSGLIISSLLLVLFSVLYFCPQIIVVCPIAIIPAMIIALCATGWSLSLMGYTKERRAAWGFQV